MPLYNPSTGITALTGDVTASGPGSAAATLAATTNATLTSLDKSTGVAIHGTNTNNNASNGYFGEIINVNPGGNVTPGATGVAVNIASISLTAGDWDVTGSANLSVAGTTVLTNIQFGISTATGSFDNVALGGIYSMNVNSATVASSGILVPAGNRRILIASPTTVYLVGQIQYTTLSTTVWTTNSYIQARRAR